MDFISDQISFDNACEWRLKYLEPQSPTAQDSHPHYYEPSCPFEGAVYSPEISPSRQVEDEEGGNIERESQNNHFGSWTNNNLAATCSHISQDPVVASYGITSTASTTPSPHDFQSFDWTTYNGGFNAHHDDPTAPSMIPRSLVPAGSCSNAYTFPDDSASDATALRMLKQVVASDSVYDASTRRRKPGRKACHWCSICKRTFTAPHNLQNHMNSHFGVKRYGCQFCDARSNTKSDMTRHEKKYCKARPCVGTPNSSEG